MSLLSLLIVLSFVSLNIMVVRVSSLTLLRWRGLLSWMSLLSLLWLFSSLSFGLVWLAR